MSRYQKNPSSDLVTFLSGALRRRASPFAVVEAVLELIDRNEPPPSVGGAVLTFDATLAGEVRDALDRRSAPIARYFQAMVPLDATDTELEGSWRAAAHALSKFVHFTKSARGAKLETVRSLARDEAVVHATQAALATADPLDVKTNRWFVPVLMVDGSDASIDALLPHFDAALGGARSVVNLFRPLLQVAPERDALRAFVRQLPTPKKRQTLKRG